MTRRSCPSELETLQGTIEEVAPAFGQSLGRLELALGRDAISLAHHGEAHALAGIRAGGPGDLPPLQALWPLQAFAPMQWPSAACALVDMVMPARNKVAAAAAMAAPDLEVTFMIILQIGSNKMHRLEAAFTADKPASNDSYVRNLLWFYRMATPFLASRLRARPANLTFDN
jgi:hypothetical protein